MRKGLAVALASLGVASAALAAEARREVTRLENGNVDVVARNTPLGRLLRQFALLTRLDTSLIEKRIELTPVDLALHDVPVEVAIGASLRASGVSFVMWGAGPTDVRVVAFSAGPPAEDAKNVAATAVARTPGIDPPMDPALAAALAAGIAPDDPDLAMIGTGAPERTLAPEDDPDLADILGPPPAPEKKTEEVVKKP